MELLLAAELQLLAFFLPPFSAGSLTFFLAVRLVCLVNLGFGDNWVIIPGLDPIDEDGELGDEVDDVVDDDKDESDEEEGEFFIN